MPVESLNAEYEKYIEDWITIRDCIEGDNAIKEKGVKYLPRPSGMTIHEYDNYKSRALFYNASFRTIQFLIGAIFRREVIVNDWPVDDELLKDVTLTDQSIQMFSKSLAEELLKMSRAGIFVDYNESENRPFLRFYSAEEITNWHVEYYNGKPILTRVILAESRVEEDPEDRFDVVVNEIRRVLELDETGFYTVEVWERNEKKHQTSNFVRLIDEDAMPTIRGNRLDFIPFQFINITDLLPSVEKPAILDLCLTNISHYKNSADLEHGLFMTALPTPWISGEIKGDEIKELHIGSGAAWLLEQGSNVGMLEFTGQGLDAIKERMTQKENYMQFLGSRLLADQKAGVEAALTIQLRHTGDNSILASLADTLGQGLRNALSWFLMWMGIQNPNISVEVNKDFIAQPMTSEELTALVGAWQKGAFGNDILYFNFKRGELIPENMNLTEFEESVSSNEFGQMFNFSEDNQNSINQGVGSNNRENEDE